MLVVGGGITGAGVALDAATRGLRTALVERHDIASGTSSKSSKLVHGGIRYLQQREIGLVYEALAERQMLRKTAPHLVRVLPFLLPVFTRDGLLPRRLARLLGATMWMYDLTGGLRIGKLHKRVSKEKALGYMPTLHADRVAASYVYYDAQTDDARLTLAVARTAADYGAAIANYTSLVGIDKGADGRSRSAHVVADGQHDRGAHGPLVVNATGVWADDVRARRGNASVVDPAREGRAHHGSVVARAEPDRGGDPGPQGSALGVRGPVGRRGRRPPVHLHRHHRHRLRRAGRRPADHARRRRVPARAINAAVTTTITESDILGTWAGSAAARARREERTHRRPLAPRTRSARRRAA